MDRFGVSDAGLRESLIAHAHAAVGVPLPYSFSDDELRALSMFFTNTAGRVFFMHNLPANVLATLASMFSRLKNPRGIRGVFVDSFLPGVLASEVAPQGHDVEAFLKEGNIRSLGTFLEYPNAREVFERFLAAGPQAYFTRLLADSAKAKKFLRAYLDAYGHNSIARMGAVWLCFEGISILAAKSLEWSRPGAGFVELSTRFVDMHAAQVYPIQGEFDLFGGPAQDGVPGLVKLMFQYYAELQGTSLGGPFPDFLRNRYRDAVSAAGGKLEVAVAGETFDVLGCLLPAATLTSVAVAVSGEALPGIVKHLLLDDTPENAALAELVVRESQAVGADQFLRHYEPTPGEKADWAPLRIAPFGSVGQVQVISSPDLSMGEEDTLVQTLLLRDDLHGLRGMQDILGRLWPQGRDRFQKLPREFETVTVPFRVVMSFRGWRDLQRQGFSTHRRTLLTPRLGFYRYDKPAPRILHEMFENIALLTKATYDRLATAGIPPHLLQYMLPLGSRVGAVYSANLRQHEFCNWQRTKPTVNHEVRQVFLAIEQELRQRYWWWAKCSRADMTPGYVFARGFNERGSFLPLSSA